MNLIKETIELPKLYSVDADAEQFRNELALQARTVTQIASVEQNDQGGVVVREMRAHLKEVEAMRQKLTKPLLDGQRLLKSLADDHAAPLKAEIDRIERLGTVWIEAEERRVAEAERVRQETIARLESQRLEAEALAQTAKGSADTQAAEELVEQAITAVDTVIVAPMPEVNRASGQRVREKLCYEVMDIRAVYAARPELCNLEIKPSAVNATCVPEMPVPGLRMWWEKKTNYTSRT